jgi:mannose/fructose/N-acetylgalactosamine-specific phosphotransferase system component IID
MAEQQDFQKAAKERLQAQQQFKKMMGGFVVLWLFMTAIWALSGAGYFWPAWVIVGTVFAGAALGWRAYGPRSSDAGPSQAQIDAEAKKFEEKG